MYVKKKKKEIYQTNICFVADDYYSTNYEVFFGFIDKRMTYF